MNRSVPLLLVAFTASALVAAAPVFAQTVPDRVIVQDSDGSFFYIQDGIRYPVNSASLSDEVIDAIPLAPAGAPAPISTMLSGVSAGGNIIQPSETFGLDLTRPIPQGAICSCSVDRRGRISTFDVSIDEVQRDAWPLVQKANRFNKAPDASFGYLAVRLTMRYIAGPSDDAFQVSGTDFKLVGSDRVLRQTASIIDPDPKLLGSVYPGSTVSGYVVYEVPKNDSSLVLLFETNFNGERGVWFSLGDA